MYIANGINEKANKYHVLLIPCMFLKHYQNLKKKKKSFSINLKSAI